MPSSPHATAKSWLNLTILLFVEDYPGSRLLSRLGFLQTGERSRLPNTRHIRGRGHNLHTLIDEDQAIVDATTHPPSFHEASSV